MANPYYFTSAATSGTQIVPLDPSMCPFSVNIQVLLASTGTYEVDFTLDPLNLGLGGASDPASITWTALTGFPANSNTSLTGALTAPVTGIRLNWSTNATGISIKVLQAYKIATT